MVVVAESIMVCSAAGFFFAKRAKSQGGDPQEGCSEQHSTAEDRRERAVSFDDGSTTCSSTASNSSVCRMLDDVLEMSPHSRPESLAGTSYSSFEAIAPSGRHLSCTLFVCARCAHGIADDEPVHMCGDAAYCSRACRDDIDDCDTQRQQHEWRADRVLFDAPLRSRALSTASLTLLCVEPSAYEDFDSTVFD